MMIMFVVDDVVSSGADFFFLLWAKDELPHSLPLSSPFPLSPLPSPPLRSRPPKYSWRVWESAVSSRSGVWGEASAYKRFGAYWSQKVQLWRQQLLLIFLKTDVIFCTKKEA